MSLSPLRSGVRVKPKHELRRIALLAFFGATFALFAAAHTQSSWPAPAEAKALKNPVTLNEKTLAAGKAVYSEKCASCHGEKGDGDGDEAYMYQPPPSSFTDAHMMGEMTDGEIFWKIGEGRLPMPSFKKRMTEEERWEVVNYIRTFAKPPAAPPPAPAKPAPKKTTR